MNRATAVRYSTRPISCKVCVAESWFSLSGMTSAERVIGLIDMDCFYAQVEQRDNPSLWGKPVAVVQPSGPGTLGGIIALSYEARSSGVKRGMMVPQAKSFCPEINICVVPLGEHIDKPDINKYREASATVFEVLNNFDPRIVVEKASVDEAFLDLTDIVKEAIAMSDRQQLLDRFVQEMDTIFPSTHVADGTDKNSSNDEDFVYHREKNLRRWIQEQCATSDSHLRIAIAGEIVEQIRSQILEKTQFYCSGGVGVNKMMSKLVCARHKPRQQTLIPQEFVPAILHNTPIEDVRFLGGKTGKNIQNLLGVKTMGELSTISLERLSVHFPNQYMWIYEISRGIDADEVKSRQLLSSIAVSKQFPGKQALIRSLDVHTWVDGLSKELAKRLVGDQTKNKRTAENLVVSVFGDSLVSRTVKIHSYNPKIISDVAWAALRTINKSSNPASWSPPLGVLSLSASRFTDGIQGESRSILEWVNERATARECAVGEIAEKEREEWTESDLVRQEQKGRNEEQAGTSKRTSINKSPVKTVETKLPSPVVVIEDDVEGVDNEGWQIFDPSSLQDVLPFEGIVPPVHTLHPSVVPSTSTNRNTQPNQLSQIVQDEVSPVGCHAPSSLGKVDKDVFDELPDFVKAEIMHEKNLEAARELKAKAVEKRGESGVAEKEVKGKRERGKKRGAEIEKAPSGVKKINQFFKKT